MHSCLIACVLASISNYIMFTLLYHSCSSNSKAVTPEGPISPTLSPMRCIGSQAELSLNKLVVGLNVEQQPISEDSFSSDKDSFYL